jgi:hypothetical protein
MRGAIPPLPHCAFMAWCSVKAQGRPYLYLTLIHRLIACIKYFDIKKFPLPLYNFDVIVHVYGIMSSKIPICYFIYLRKIHVDSWGIPLCVLFSQNERIMEVVVSDRLPSDLRNYWTDLNTNLINAVWTKSPQTNLVLFGIQWVPGALSLRVKRLGAWSWPLAPSSAEVKECLDLYLHSPIRLHGVVLS